MTNSAAFDEGDLLPLSALQHLVYCERQYALIHVEQVWAESGATVEGHPSPPVLNELSLPATVWMMPVAAS